PAQSFAIFGSAGTTARVTSTAPVTATAVINGNDTVFVNGQAVDLAAAVRVVPHFVTGNGTNSQLVLSNPNSTAIEATVTLYSETGGAIHFSKPGPSSKTVGIPAHGLVSLDRTIISKLPFAPPVKGWLKIEPPNVPLNGVAILDGGTFVSAIPMQRPAPAGMMFSQLSDSSDLFTELDLVNASTAAA